MPGSTSGHSIWWTPAPLVNCDCLSPMSRKNPPHPDGFASGSSCRRSRCSRNRRQIRQSGGHLKPLKAANINVVFMYAFIGLSSDKAVMIFKFSDNDRAIELLQSIHVRILDAKAFGILESGEQPLGF